jgi:TPR repeat protein
MGDEPDCKAQCDAKNGPSCNTLGLMYQKGQGTAVDPMKAASLFDLACNYGSGAGCTNAGKAYADGMGVPTDDLRAFSYFSRGCDLKNSDGCTEAGVRLIEGKGVPEDVVHARQLFVRACDDLNGLACYWRGVTFEQALGEENVDDERAAAYFDRSCFLGNMKGCASLGNCYALGKGVDEDFDKGLDLLDKACKSGNNWACSRVKDLKGAASQ